MGWTERGFMQKLARPYPESRGQGSKPAACKVKADIPSVKTSKPWSVPAGAAPNFSLSIHPRGSQLSRSGGSVTGNSSGLSWPRPSQNFLRNPIQCQTLTWPRSALVTGARTKRSVPELGAKLKQFKVTDGSLDPPSTLHYPSPRADRLVGTLSSQCAQAFLPATSRLLSCCSHFSADACLAIAQTFPLTRRLPLQPLLPPSCLRISSLLVLSSSQAGCLFSHFSRLSANALLPVAHTCVPTCRLPRHAGALPAPFPQHHPAAQRAAAAGGPATHITLWSMRLGRAHPHPHVAALGACGPALTALMRATALMKMTTMRCTPLSLLVQGKRIWATGVCKARKLLKHECKPQAMCKFELSFVVAEVTLVSAFERQLST
eukprot:1138598-Pelagomonas_calceolata.AAC.2